MDPQQQAAWKSVATNTRDWRTRSISVTSHAYSRRNHAKTCENDNQSIVAATART